MRLRLTYGTDHKGSKSGSKTLEMLKRFKRCLVVRSMKKMFQYQTASYWSYLMTAECFRKNYPVSSVIPSYYMLSLHPLYVTIMRVQFSSIWCGLSVTEEDKWGLPCTYQGSKNSILNQAFKSNAFFCWSPFLLFLLFFLFFFILLLLNSFLSPLYIFWFCLWF